MRAPAAIILALAAHLAGCGGGSEGSRDAAVEMAKILGGNGLPPARPCTPGQDQTCNDDPAMSALAGRCDNSGQCLCNGDFSYNVNTGHCRAGSLCSASAGDPFRYNVPLAVDDCAARPAAQCLSTTIDDQALYNSLTVLVREECGFPSYTPLRVELTGGCVTLLEVSPDTTIEAQLVPCLERVLSAVRWDCAPPMGCVYDYYGVPI
jgi:hypothetical protein